MTRNSTGPTPKELEAAIHVLRGGSPKAAARALGRAPSTIRSQLRSFALHCGCETWQQAIHVALDRGWLRRDEL